MVIFLIGVVPQAGSGTGELEGAFEVAGGGVAIAVDAVEAVSVREFGGVVIEEGAFDGVHSVEGPLGVDGLVDEGGFVGVGGGEAFVVAGGEVV